MTRIRRIELQMLGTIPICFAYEQAPGQHEVAAVRGRDCGRAGREFVRRLV